MARRVDFTLPQFYQIQYTDPGVTRATLYSITNKFNKKVPCFHWNCPRSQNLKQQHCTVYDRQHQEGIMISSLRTIDKILNHIVGETKRSPCPTANNPSLDFICMNATLKDSIHSLRNVIRITLYSAQTLLKTAPQGNYFSVAFICFRDSDLFSFICDKKNRASLFGEMLSKLS